MSFHFGFECCVSAVKTRVFCWVFFFFYYYSKTSAGDRLVTESGENRLQAFGYAMTNDCMISLNVYEFLSPLPHHTSD